MPSVNCSPSLKLKPNRTLGDVRRIAYDLRPPALDQLGLVPAIQEHVTALGRPGGLDIVLETPEELPELPAAIEVAAYRIVLEALTNVTHHASASRCNLRLEANGWLEVEIVDNDRGLPESLKPGVGISSMIERAAELGGTCTIITKPGGSTQVLAQLPLELAYNDGVEGV
ncbi:MAG TPA: ATP-binding protein [Anaerolineales bacterium]|nr:hypothetical protein [Anaerolineales bacterium]HUV26130.1 ATP-binding protein [Anaerolineales bacterium]HUV91814.1 ATP-binding protein [Anaerolineales bacterium]